MSADSRSIGEPGSRTSSGPAHLNLYRHWLTGPSINMTDSCSSPSSCRSIAWIFSSQTDIMTSDGEVVIFSYLRQTHTHTHSEESRWRSICVSVALSPSSLNNTLNGGWMQEGGLIVSKDSTRGLPIFKWSICKTNAVKCLFHLDFIFLL